MHHEHYADRSPASAVFQLEPKDQKKSDEIERLKRKQETRDEQHRRRQYSEESRLPKSSNSPMYGNRDTN